MLVVEKSNAACSLREQAAFLFMLLKVQSLQKKQKF